MAITVEEALELARKQLGSDNIMLSETDTLYIAGVERERGEDKPGEMPISINKRTGVVSEVLLPSEEGFISFAIARRVRSHEAAVPRLPFGAFHIIASKSPRTIPGKR